MFQDRCVHRTTSYFVMEIVSNEFESLHIFHRLHPAHQVHFAIEMIRKNKATHRISCVIILGPETQLLWISSMCCVWALCSTQKHGKLCHRQLQSRENGEVINPFKTYSRIVRGTILSILKITFAPTTNAWVWWTFVFCFAVETLANLIKWQRQMNVHVTRSMSRS